MDYWQSLSLLIINDEPILNLVNNQAITLFMKAIKNNNVYWKKLQMLLSTFHRTPEFVCVFCIIIIHAHFARKHFGTKNERKRMGKFHSIEVDSVSSIIWRLYETGNPVIYHNVTSLFNTLDSAGSIKMSINLTK